MTRDIAAILLLVAICLVAYFGVSAIQAIAGANPPTTTGPIDMVQPQGFPARDQQYADTNKTNALANKINAEAGYLEAQSTAVLMDAEGNLIGAKAEATLTVAESCEIRNDCFLYSQQIEAENNKIPWYVWVVIVIVVLFLVFGVTFR
jgi:hypothetical protein